MNLWDKLVTWFTKAKNAVVDFFTDGEANVGRVNKNSFLEIFFTTGMFFVPIRVAPEVAVPLRFAISKGFVWLLDRFTFMKSASSTQAVNNSLLIAAIYTVILAILVYGFNYVFPTIWVGAILNVILAVVNG